jgi:hypothetical protein
MQSRTGIRNPCLLPKLLAALQQAGSHLLLRPKSVAGSVRPFAAGHDLRKWTFNVEVSGLRGFSRRSARLPGWASFTCLFLQMKQDC